MQERVSGYADAVLDGLKAKDLSTAAAQLKAFSELLAGSDELRAAMALPTTSPSNRAAIVNQLLAKKAMPAMVNVLSYAARQGDGADFPEEVGFLAYVGASKSAGMVPLDEGPLGRLAARDRVNGYADALLAPFDERRLGDVEDELFRFMRTVDGNEDLRVALSTNELPVQVRTNLVNDLLARRASSETVRLASYAARVGRPRDYLELLSALVDRVASEAKRRVADVRSAVKMTAAQQQRLGAALSRLTGTPVDVQVTVEPDLLGGFVASVGDLVVDASTRHRLSQARAALAVNVQAPGGRQESN